MKWRKLGQVYCPRGDVEWARSSAMLPTPLLLDEDTVRVYAGFRDEQGRSRVGFVEVRARDPLDVVSVSPRPLLDLGQPGTFDENGIVPSSIVDTAGTLRLYYVGFQPGVNVRYFMFSGLATSSDEGRSFMRYSRTPVLDRTDTELYFRTAPFAMRGSVWKLYYVAGEEWTDVKGKKVPVYRIKFSESDDGIHWPEKGIDCFEFESDDEHGFGRPCVFKGEDSYRMFYSIRYRSKGYRLGYAESTDGVKWERLDDAIGLDVSEHSWDSEMICYSSVIRAGGETYMFYNGNNFGETGFGVAVLEDN